MLELANLEWVVDAGRPAMRSADNTTGRTAYPRAGTIDASYFSHPGYAKRHALPVAIAGTHGGGFQLKAFTLSTFIKPAAQMGRRPYCLVFGPFPVASVAGSPLPLRG